MPTIYLDLRTNYASVPAGSLPVGLGSPALFSVLQALPRPGGNPLLSLPITVPFAARLDGTATSLTFSAPSKASDHSSNTGTAQFDHTAMAEVGH